MTEIGDQISTTLAHALEVRLDRQHLLATNIANANTPGFVPLDLNFEAALSQSLGEPGVAQTDPRHLSPAAARLPASLYYDPIANPGLDGNAVSLDREMAKLGENSLQYNATNRALQKKLGMLRYAISEGGSA